MWLENIFYQTVVCFFICITLLFKDQKFLILIKSNLSIFIFWIMFLVSNIQNLCLTQSHEYSLCSFLYSCSFHVWDSGPLPARGVHYERYRCLVLVWLSRTSRFHCFNTICWTTSAFPVDLLLLTFCCWIARWCQSVDGMCVGLFLYSLFYSIDIRSILSQIAHCISHYMFTTIFEIR